MERVIDEQMDQLENSSPRCHVTGMELEGTGGHWRAPPPPSPRARVIPGNECAPLLLCKILRAGAPDSPEFTPGSHGSDPPQRIANVSPIPKVAGAISGPAKLDCVRSAHGPWSSHIVSDLLGLLAV